MVTAQQYRLNPAWALTRDGAALLIEGGGDARYSIDLEGAEDSFFARTADAASSFTRDALSQGDQRILEQLITAEIVTPVLPVVSTLRIAVMGDSPQAPLDAQPGLVVVEPGQNHDVVVLYRSTSTLRGLLDAVSYREIAAPHLLVDAAYHHTVSIGPLVFPGETACLECLYGRLASRWADAEPPPAPRVASMASRLIAELTALELMRIGSGDTGLANKTVAWDLDSRAVATDRLLKVQMCPVCTRHRTPSSGSIALPWRTA